MELVFNAPDGCTFDKNSIKIEDGKITIQAEEKQKFSKNWEEFCGNNGFPTGGLWFSADCFSTIMDFTPPSDREKYKNRLIPDKFLSPLLALMKLLAIREKEYTKGWEPDWGNLSETKSLIYIPEKVNWISSHWSGVLCFPTAKLRDEFEKNWKGLIEIAKPLL